MSSASVADAGPAPAPVSTLADLPRGASARVRLVRPRGAGDAIAQRLGELGFVPGEELRVLAHGPAGADPILVQVGFTRFALRRSEAARIELAPQ